MTIEHTWKDTGGNTDGAQVLHLKCTTLPRGAQATILARTDGSALLIVRVLCEIRRSCTQVRERTSSTTHASVAAAQAHALKWAGKQIAKAGR